MNGFEKRVKELCDEVEQLYPANRIKATKEKVSRFWNTKPAEERLPYVIMQFPCDEQKLDGLEGQQRELISQLWGIVNHAAYLDDYVPLFTFGIIQALIPAYFGCTQVFAKNGGSVEVKPIISEPDDAYRLKPVGFVPGTLGGDMLEKMRFFHTATQGRIMLAETDMQGPFSVASQIWGIEEFLIAVYEEPEAVHHLLRLTTNAIIEYLHLMLEVTEGNLSPCHCMPCTWIDKSRAVCVSEDLLAVVSASVTEEFISPYLSEIGKEFGGVVVHTCGSMNHSIQCLAHTPYLIGVNCSTSETDLPRLVKDGGNRLCYLTHSSSVTCGDLKVLTPVEQMELCRKSYGKAYAGMVQINPLDFPLDLQQVHDAAVLD